MGQYFDRFPKITYDVRGTGDSARVIMTNLMMRFKLREAFKNNLFAYYDYVVPDGMTIENLAERYYGSPQHHWVIMLANDMSDPLYDWPLSQLAFNKYIIAKYGTIAEAQTRVSRYEQTITRFHANTQTTDTIKLTISENTYNDLAVSGETIYNLEDSSSIAETITKSIIYAYDDEVLLNDEKRNIHLIKKEYLPQVLKEFQNEVYREGAFGNRAGLRTLRNRV